MSLTTSGPGHADQKRVHTCLFNVFVDRSHVNAKCKQSQFSLNICLKFPVILSRVCTRLCVRACVRVCVCVHAQILGLGSKRLLTLTHRAQIKRFTQDLLKLLKFQASKQVTIGDFTQAYHW